MDHFSFGKAFTLPPQEPHTWEHLLPSDSQFGSNRLLQNFEIRKNNNP